MLEGHYLNKEQEKAIDLINSLKTITKEQLIKTGIFKRTHQATVEQKIMTFNKYSYNRSAAQFKIIDDTYYISVSSTNFDNDMIKCIDVMISFDMKKIKWYAAGEYPFKLSFSKEDIDENGDSFVKVYDVAILVQGEEAIFNKVLEKSPCERLIVIVDKKNVKKFREIITEKQVKYCTLDDGITYFDSLSEIS